HPSPPSPLPQPLTTLSPLRLVDALDQRSQSREVTAKDPGPKAVRRGQGSRQPSPRSRAAQTWPRPTRRRRLSAERRGGAGWLRGGSAGGRGRVGGDRPPRSSGRRAQTPGPAPEGASAAPGSARSRRARGLPLAAWSATLGTHPPPRWGPSPREDGVLDHLQSCGVRWMMYWIVFALYTVIETVADQTVAWFPLYYELKIAFVIWLLSPYTRGASLIYRKFLHPLLSSKEREIDDYIVQAKERGYETMVNFGRQGLNLAATAAVTAAVKVIFYFPLFLILCQIASEQSRVAFYFRSL
uniref:Receptor expression-enhancing protein n=1 Tax=Bos indicus x Bos taurus TaxID=30522 RepID=A0A4W2C0I7_BOBOX